MCWKTIKRWFGGGNDEPKPTPAPTTSTSPPRPPLTPSTIPYPEEPRDDSKTVANTDVDAVINQWLVERQVPQIHWKFWRNQIIIEIYDAWPDSFLEWGIEPTIPACAWDGSDGLRHYASLAPYFNVGVTCHEQAHNAWPLLTPEQQADFMEAYDRLKTTDPLIVRLFEINDYGLRGGHIEGHAEFYRYLCEYMPEELKQYYPKLFVE